jgi:hypothetical protein
MRYLLLLVAVLSANCASQKTGFESPSGEITLAFDPGSGERAAIYKICARSGNELGEVRSIIDAETVKNVPGLPVDQKVLWSSSGKTAVIYENMSDASPEYQYVILRLRSGSQGFDAYKVDLGSRFAPQPSADVYGHWPTVRRISDEEVELEWDSEPRHTTVSIDQLISASKTTSEQDAPSNGG